MVCSICWIVFASLFNIYQCSFEKRVSVSFNKISIRYEHQIADDTFDFYQTVNTSLFSNIPSTDCSPNNEVYCLKWSNFGQFQIDKIDHQCDNYSYTSAFIEPIIVAFDISKMFLYGANEKENQTWPIKIGENDYDSFVSKADNSQAVLESIWYTSTGFYVQVAQNVPLFVQYESNTLKIIAENRDPYIRGNITQLSYKICKLKNVKEAVQHAIAHSLGKPATVPDYRMVELPIWSTWAKYLTHINESTVLEFANTINSYEFPNSQLEIDDMWETCYGSLTVDEKRFPSMRALVDQLHAKGFRVTIWVHPFVNLNCTPHFEDGMQKNVFVRSNNGTVHTKWWNGDAAYIDFTNHEAVDWFQKRLQRLLDQTGIDSFKFDAGESSWSPQIPIFHTMADDHPETILKSYVQMAASFGDKIEVRTGRQTQRYSVFVRMMDRETAWTGRLALSTLIPELLHMNIVGYPYVLPDMIGGNLYDKQVLTKELYVRWLQINVFMPALQFSFPPWDFDEEVLNITYKFVKLHQEYAPKIYEVMKRATKEDILVNAPIWWIDPTDNSALTIDSEFLLGDEILVAPVLIEGANSRDIYFPSGVWRDENIKNASLIIGPTWVRSYPASLAILPFFTKIPSSSSVLSPSLLVMCLTLLVFLYTTSSI